jgi:hypothetical protein
MSHKERSSIGGNIVFEPQILMRRFAKYIGIAVIVGFVAHAVPEKKLDGQEILAIALSAAAAFSVIDMLTPSICSDSKYVS